MKREKKTILCSNIFIAKRSLALAVTFVIIAGFLYVSKENSKNIQEELVTSQEIMITNQPSEPLVTGREPMEASSKLCCYVCGAVKNAGVYYVSSEAIKETAVRMAGGFDEHADVNYVNLAEPVTAGEQIYIPTEDETAEIAFPQDGQTESTAGSPGLSETSQPDDRVNINTAGKEELMTLPGIGENKAEAIIAYREAQGKFQSSEELMNIRGIKEGVYNKIKDLIIVG